MALTWPSSWVFQAKASGWRPWRSVCKWWVTPSILAAGICPEVFQMKEGEEKAEVIKPEDGPEGLVQEAIDTCPASCIHWEE